MYSRKAKLIIRIIAIIAVVILITANIFKHLFTLWTDDNTIVPIELYYLIINIIVIILFILVFIFPQKFMLVAIACSYYSVNIITNEPHNCMGILMYCLGTSILIFRGFFRNHAKIKITILALILLILESFRLRFSSTVIRESLLDDFAFSFVYIIGMVFIYGYASRNSDYSKKLNIAKYNELKESDAEMLRRVLANQQYKVIAIDLNRTEGTIRNRLNKVYDILGVGDRTGFITTYSGFEVVYEPEPSEPAPQETNPSS